MTHQAGAEGATDPRMVMATIASAIVANRSDSAEMFTSLRFDVDSWLQDMASARASSPANARAVFLPKGMSADIDAHRPVVPATPLEAMTSRGLLSQHEAGLAPLWVYADGCRAGWRGGRPHPHIYA